MEYRFTFLRRNKKLASKENLYSQNVLENCPVGFLQSQRDQPTAPTRRSSLSRLASSHQSRRACELSELVLQLGIPGFPSLVWVVKPWPHTGLSLPQSCPQTGPTAPSGARTSLRSQARSSVKYTSALALLFLLGFLSLETRAFRRCGKKIQTSA